MSSTLPVDLMGDAPKILQVLGYLVENALKFSDPSTGRLVVSVCRSGEWSSGDGGRGGGGGGDSRSRDGSKDRRKHIQKRTGIRMRSKNNNRSRSDSESGSSSDRDGSSSSGGSSSGSWGRKHRSMSSSASEGAISDDNGNFLVDFVVEDNGIGMNQETCDLLFQSMFQSDR